jgi:hypothetical protein
MSGDEVLEIFLKLGARTLLVVEAGMFAGIIHKKEILVLLKSNCVDLM